MFKDTRTQAKNSKICNFWTFWPVIQEIILTSLFLIYGQLFKIGPQNLDTLHIKKFSFTHS